MGPLWSGKTRRRPLPNLDGMWDGGGESAVWSLRYSGTMHAMVFWLSISNPTDLSMSASADPGFVNHGLPAAPWGHILPEPGEAVVS